MDELLAPKLEIGPKVGKLEEANEKIQLYYENNAIVTRLNKLTCDMCKTECAILELLR
jgi:hypothetical protein